MNINEIKLTGQMIDLALKDAIPSARMKFTKDRLPFKRVLLSKHASQRFEERFGKGFKNIDIARAVGKALGKGHYSLSYKDITSFGVDVQLGEATALFQLIKLMDKFNSGEEIYLVKTLYLKMNGKFIEMMEHIHDENIKDQIFQKMIEDQFFKGKTERLVFAELKRPSENMVKRVRKAIHKTHNMIDPIAEMKNNNSLLDEIEEKDQYKFGDGVKPTPTEIDDTVYMDRGKYDPLDDLLDSSLFDVDEASSQFKFGDGEETITTETAQGPLGLDLDASDFPW